MSARRVCIGVIGSGVASAELDGPAEEVGREIARRNAVLICGGLGGVMAAAARGSKEAGGFTVGVLPGSNTAEANEYIDFAVASNMGQARNAIIVQTADALIAVGGGYGTLSEIALALKIGKSVTALLPSFRVPGMNIADSAQDAVNKAIESIDAGAPRTVIV